MFLLNRDLMFKNTLIRPNLVRLAGKRALLNSTHIQLLGYRLFSNSITKLNIKLDNEVAFKSKKPLSRIPIGAKDTGKDERSSGLSNFSGSIEFATWKAALLFLVIGSGLYHFFNKEKKRLEVEREAESNRGYGKPVVGGPFNLIDCRDSTQFTEKDLLGKWSIIYFGFTHCPDICPDELDKLGVWLTELKGNHDINLQPIFVTCDPARDSPDVVKEYLKDFHEDIIGLTGSYDEVKHACKQYRVYFSTPPNVKPGQDYLVDHSVFFYLMDPEGNFVQVLGLNSDEVAGVKNIREYIDAFVSTAERQERENKWYSFLLK